MLLHILHPYALRPRTTLLLSIEFLISIEPNVHARERQERKLNSSTIPPCCWERLKTKRDKGGRG